MIHKKGKDYEFEGQSVTSRLSLFDFMKSILFSKRKNIDKEIVTN